MRRVCAPWAPFSAFWHKDSLGKNRDDRGPARPLLGYMFYVLTQGFSGKVAFTGILEEHCSETLSAFPHKDSF